MSTLTTPATPAVPTRFVQGLATIVEAPARSPEEWARLIRAYSVLHEPDKARDALASARKALGANADIDALARELGI